MSTRMKKLGAGGLVLATAMGVGIAFASWTATGGGTGAAKAVTAIALTATPNTPSTDPATQLYPGRTGANVYVKITNPNPYPVNVTSITQDGTIVTAPTNAACDASTGVSFATQSGTFSVPANSNADFILPAASMTNDSVDACQGKTFSIPMSLSGVSAA